MAFTKSDKINLVQLAMKRVNVVPYEENQIAFATNTGKIELSDTDVTVCESYINVINENRTCHIGFSTVLSAAVPSTFYIEVDGVNRAKQYPNTNATMQFMDFFLLGIGLHHVAVKAKSESRVIIEPREARLGVYL